MAKSVNTQVYGPPQSVVPITDLAWRQWFTDVLWPIIGKGIDQSGAQGSFPQLQVGKARFTRDNEFQELINLDQGLYVTYSSTVGNIIYGFASNVYRAAGSALTVGGQFSAYAEAGTSGTAFGGNINAFVRAGSQAAAVALELDTVYEDSTSHAPKWGLNLVFFDNTTQQGLGSNFYNYSSEGIVFTAGARSVAGEYCGWTVGLDFLDGWCDQASVPTWDSTVTYGEGAIVSSGGVLWKAIVANTNSSPAAGATWVQRTYSGTSNLAVGIDFSSISTTTMAVMASAIRLRSAQYIHWEETGAIGTTFDATGSILNLCTNQGTRVFGVGISSGIGNLGVGYWTQAAIALGAGATATLGKVGGTGPATATQVGWEKVVLNGSTYYRALWQ